MYKLLNASFSRLRKNKIFLGLVILTIIIAAFMLISEYLDKVKYSSVFGISSNTTDILFTSFINIIGFFSAIFTSLFVGAEYSDGTIRNKIIVGNKRKNIYLSNLITSIIVGLLLELINLLIIMLVGTPLIGKIQINILDFSFIILDMILLIVVFSSIFNFIAMLCSNITLSTVGSLLLILIMYVFCMSISGIANSTKYLKIQDVDEYGNIVTQYIEDENYPGDFKKNLCKEIINIIPTGQAMEISSKDININEIKTYPIYSLVISIFINILGIYLFNKKELK